MLPSMHKILSNATNGANYVKLVQKVCTNLITCAKFLPKTFFSAPNWVTYFITVQ